MTTILWVSRHSPLPAQIGELLRLYGPDTRVIEDGAPFENAEAILRRFAALPEPRELLAVAPLSVLRHLCAQGVRPLWAEMKTRCPPMLHPEKQTFAGGRVYEFVRFRRLKAVTLEMEDL